MRTLLSLAAAILLVAAQPQIAGAQPSFWHDDSAVIVPWLDASSPTSSSTSLRVSGQKRSAQRGTMPPWL